MNGDVIALSGFALLVLLGAFIALRDSRDRADRVPPVALQLFLAGALVMTAIPLVRQRELWPFADWKLMADVTTADVGTLALVCGDATGESFAVDHRAWSPLTEEELLAWIRGPFTRLDAAAQDSAKAFLLGLAEAARARARQGGDPAAHASLLGRFAAPSHLLHPKRWTSAMTTPATPCASLWLLAREWNVVARAERGAPIRETLVWRFPPAP